MNLAHMFVCCNVHAPTGKGPSMQASVCQGRVGCKFIMVRRADGTVLRGLCWDCGGPLINHTDVIGRWEPHGRCRAQRWPHPASPLRLTSDRDGERQWVGEEKEARWDERVLKKRTEMQERGGFALSISDMGILVLGSGGASQHIHHGEMTFKNKQIMVLDGWQMTTLQ